METYINDSLVAGIIRLPSSPAGARFFLVAKKDKSLRPCIDDRGLNGITVWTHYPLPLITSAFELLQEATILKKLDLRNAYHFVWTRRHGRLPSTHLQDNMNTWLWMVAKVF